MSVGLTSMVGAGSGESSAPGQAADDDGAGWQIKAAMVLLVLVAAGLSLGLAVFHSLLPPLVFHSLAPAMATTVALMLAGFPLVIGFVQATSRNRQLLRLKGIGNWPVATTTYYKVALASLDALRPASVTQRDYRVPMICFCFTVVLCSLAVFLSYSFPETMAYRSVVLGGVKVISLADDQIYQYQQETFTAIAFAFFGAYVSIIHGLLRRITNNDIYPISFHGYTAWILSAGVMAGVLRQVFDIVGLTLGQPGLVLVGFAAGLSPNLFVTTLARRAFDALNIVGDKRDPDKAVFPTNMHLLMIDGITADEIARLDELGIDNAQILAVQNPFVLWPRLPYDLSLLVDWIGQAQLCTHVRETGLRTLRDNAIGDIFEFRAALADEGARAAVCEALKLPPALAVPLMAGIDSDPSFIRLAAVRTAMAAS